MQEKVWQDQRRRNEDEQHREEESHEQKVTGNMTACNVTPSSGRTKQEAERAMMVMQRSDRMEDGKGEQRGRES